jgi:hypothetical protein
MGEKSDRDDTSSEAASVDVGRRETLQLATLAAALGAGLSVSFHADPASADGAQQLQFKFYRQQQKGEGEMDLVYTATLPEDVSQKLLGAFQGRLQLKCYGTDLLGSSSMQVKVVQAKQPSTQPPVKGSWDVRKNQKT